MYLHTHEVAKVYTQLHMQHLIGSKNRGLGSKIERKKVFLTEDKVTRASNKTAVDFNATRCYAYGPHNLTVLRCGDEEGCGQAETMPFEPQLD